MNAVFLRKKFNLPLLVLFIFGLLFIGLYIFLITMDDDSNGNLTFLIFGILISLVALWSWLLNYGAFLRVDENSIKAKYHWFGKIDSKLFDVTFATSKLNTLILQLNTGKTHTIIGVANSMQLASYIRRNMLFDPCEQPKEMIEKMNDLKALRKKGIIYVCLGVVLMFLNIFLTVFLTGEREISDFTQTDWTLFSVMGLIEIALTVTVFYFANKTGKYNVPIEKLQYAIRRRVIETCELPSGNAIKVYADDNYSFRITVLGYPNEESVYYITEAFDQGYTLFKVYNSKIYESIDQLSESLEDLIEIDIKNKEIN